MSFNQWLYYNDVTITPDYTVQFTVYKGVGTSSGTAVYCDNHCKDDFSDIRFSIDRINNLSYWIESYVSGVSATIIVNFLSLTPVTVYIYYGNQSAISESSGSNTFTFFDDFPGTTLDSGKWAVISNQPYVVSGGTLTVNGANDSSDYIQSILSFGVEYSLVMKSRFYNAGGSSCFGFGLGLDVTNIAEFFDTSGYAAYSIKSGASANAGSPLTGSNYYIYEIKRISSSSQPMIRNGTTILGPSSTNIPTVNLYVRFREYASGYNQSHDYVYVKRISGNNPIFGTWSGEQSNMTMFTINESVGVSDSELSLIATFVLESIGLMDSSVRAIHMRVINEVVGVADNSRGFVITVVNELFHINDVGIVAYIMNEVMGLRAGDDPVESAGHDEYGRSVGRRVNEYGHHVYGRLTMYGNRISGLFKTKTNTEAVVIPQFAIINETVVIESNGDELTD